MSRRMIVAVFIILAIISLFLFVQKIRNTNPKQSFQVSESAAPISTKAVSYNCPDSETAFTALSKNHTVESQDSSFGKMVTSIDGIKQGDGKYWLYSINGKEATTSADTYICQPNDKVEWELK